MDGSLFGFGGVIMGALAVVFAVVWLVVIVYLLGLATRLVRAVEEIARQLGTKHRGTVRQGPFS